MMKIMLPPGSLTSTGAINLEWLLYFQSVTQMDPIHLPIIFIGGYMYINIYIYIYIYTPVVPHKAAETSEITIGEVKCCDAWMAGRIH